MDYFAPLPKVAASESTPASQYFVIVIILDCCTFLLSNGHVSITPNAIVSRTIDNEGTAPFTSMTINPAVWRDKT
jgi:hypothetical protein